MAAASGAAPRGDEPLDGWPDTREANQKNLVLPWPHLRARYGLNHCAAKQYINPAPPVLRKPSGWQPREG